ncbi:MAG: glycyl radical protein [Christensenella sp.]|nr:glycyl radical protein [Christensenella sp.]
MSVTEMFLNINDVMAPETEEYKRCQRLKDSLINVKSEVCLERAKIVTRVYQETEGLDPLERKARAFDAVLKEMTLFVVDEELICGHQASKRRSSPLFPEFAVEWVDEEIETFPTRAQDKFQITPEQIADYRENVVSYWRGKTFNDRVRSYLTEDVNLLREDAGLFSVGLHEDGGFGHVALSYEKLLKKGFDGIKKDIREKMDGLTDWKAEDMQKRKFYRACISICDSMIAFANRYADLTAQLAEQEKDEKRKAELLRMSQNCRRVPEFPANDFYEALQSIWFVQVAVQIYDNGVSITPGRFDQYVYPYYEKDILSGALTKIKAQEILESFWIKFTEPIKIYRAIDAAFHAGYPMGQNLAVGGIRPDGTDGTNDLSYRCLEAHSHILLMQPNFSVRLHGKSPFEFVKRACEAIRMGNGMPQIVNDEVYIPAMLNVGVPFEEARDYVPVGCVETTPLNTWGRCNGGYFNLSKIVELTLNNGVCGISGKQVSIKTGDPREFKTFDEFLDAYKKQMNYCMGKLVKWDNTLDMVHEQLAPTPLTSMLVDDCIEKGKDVTSGGARYNWTGPLGVGIANVGDSLYAIKKVVYDDKLYTMDQILDALDHNFKGQEALREFLKNKVPKYGNDLEGPDDMVKIATDAFFDSMKGYETYRGGPFVAALLPVASYVAFGMATAALPDGKASGEPLADGISPDYGVDREGPTAVMKSVSKIDHIRCANGVIFNQKLSPMTVSTPEGMKKWIDMVMTYISLGGGHVQFNIVSADTLRDAQKDPDKYKSLVVRVAGYSAFFNELADEVQESIIARTEHEL